MSDDLYQRLLRLVALGDADAAERLTQEARRRGDHVAELHAFFLSAPPSEARWEALTARLEALPEDALADALPLARAHLEAWPAELCPLPEAWEARLEQGETLACASVARACHASHAPVEAMETFRDRVLPALPDLRNLSLLACSLGQREDVALDIAEHPSLGGLRHLDLRWNRLSAELVAAFIEPPRSEQLRHLDLDLNPIGDADVLAAHAWPRLETLSLNECVDGSRLSALLERAPGLQRLSVGSTTRAAADALTRAELPELRRLDLSGTPLGDDGAATLAQAPWLPRLDVLHVAHCGIGAEGLRALSTRLGSLRELQLMGNDVADAGFASLASIAPTLTRLNASACGVGDAGLEAFAGAAPDALEVLYLQNNRVGEAGLRALARAAPGALRILNLSLNPISDRGLEALVSARSLPLERLELNWCSLGNRGARILATHLNLPRMRELILTHNEIGSRGARALARSTAIQALDTLDVSGNRIGRRALRALDAVASLGGEA